MDKITLLLKCADLHLQVDELIERKKIAITAAATAAARYTYGYSNKSNIIPNDEDFLDYIEDLNVDDLLHNDVVDELYTLCNKLITNECIQEAHSFLLKFDGDKTIIKPDDVTLLWNHVFRTLLVDANNHTPGWYILYWFLLEKISHCYQSCWHDLYCASIKKELCDLLTHLMKYISQEGLFDECMKETKFLISPTSPLGTATSTQHMHFIRLLKICIRLHKDYAVIVNSYLQEIIYKDICGIIMGYIFDEADFHPRQYHIHNNNKRKLLETHSLFNK